MGKARRGRNDSAPRSGWVEPVEADSQPCNEPTATVRKRLRQRRQLRNNA
jgi:hypothetical protein